MLRGVSCRSAGRGFAGTLVSHRLRPVSSRASLRERLRHEGGDERARRSSAHDRRERREEAGLLESRLCRVGWLVRADSPERFVAEAARDQPRRDHRRHLRADPHPERSPAADRAAAEERGERRR